jgi:hypothetical protein
VTFTYSRYWLKNLIGKGTGTQPNPNAPGVPELNRPPGQATTPPAPPTLETKPVQAPPPILPPQSVPAPPPLF